jgi:hypothetical protein
MFVLFKKNSWSAWFRVARGRSIYRTHWSKLLPRGQPNCSGIKRLSGLGGQCHFREVCFFNLHAVFAE